MLESSGKVTVTIKREAGCDGQIKVKYWTEDGRGGNGTHAAIANSDYVPCEGELTFDHGQARKKITIEIIDDEAYEKDETFLVHLEIVVRLVLCMSNFCISRFSALCSPRNMI